MSYTKKHGEENAAVLAAAAQIVPTYSDFYDATMLARGEIMGRVLSKLEAQFPGIPRDRIRTQVFNAIRATYKPGHGS